MKRLFLFSTIVLFSSCGGFLDSSYGDVDYDRKENRRSPSIDSNMPSEPGKCYAKCLVVDEYDKFEEEIFVYTGENEEQEGIVYETIITEPETEKWVKKEAKNCLSKNKNDCLVWCLTKTPEMSEDFYIVQDTNLIKDFKIEIVSYSELVKEGGYTEWKEVVCQADVTPSFYRGLQEVLIEQGFLVDIPADGKINQETKEALVKYQKKNYLPVGSLDVETLRHMGLEYD